MGNDIFKCYNGNIRKHKRKKESTMKKKLISVLLGITLVVSNCSYVGAVDIGDSAVEVPDFSDEVQEDELFSDGSEEVRQPTRSLNGRA